MRFLENTRNAPARGRDVFFQRANRNGKTVMEGNLNASYLVFSLETKNSQDIYLDIVQIDLFTVYLIVYSIFIIIFYT